MISYRAWAALIFVVALAARTVHVWQLRSSPFFATLMGDSRGYDEWALRLAGGDWIGNEVFYQAPLYPYFLGLVYAAAGRDLLVVRLVQAAIGSSACVLLGLAATRLFSLRAGLIAGFGLALYAPAIFLDGLIQKSTLDVFFVCLVLALIATILTDSRQLGRWMGLGAALGGLCLTRENALVLAGIAIVWAVVVAWQSVGANQHRARRFAVVVVLLVGLTMVLAPVAVRNARVGGGFYLTTSQFGSNLFIGNNAAADGTYMALREGRGDPAFERQDATELAQAALGRSLSPAEVSTYWRDRAVQFITSQPVAWLELLARKGVLLLNDREMLDTEAQESHAEWSAILRVTGHLARFGLLLPLALLGVIQTWQDRGRLWVLYWMAGGYAASVLAFFVFARYRYPLVPFAMLFAAAAIAQLPAFLRESSRPRLALTTATVVGVAALAHWPVLSSDAMRAVTETNLGVALQQVKRLDEAGAHYRRAIEIDPGYAAAYNNLGVVLRDQGRLDEAIAAYRSALERRPDYAEVEYNLAAALVEQRRPEEAISHFRIALRSRPATAGAHNNFGVALAAVGRQDEAIVEYAAALALEPDFREARRNLGDALADEKRYPEAIAHFARLTELEPGNPEVHYDLGNVLMEARRVPDAANAYRAAIRLAPDSAQAHTKLGVALAAQGQMDEAIGEFRQALRLDPGFADARRFLEIAIRSRR